MEWISVKDKLPEIDSFCQVFTNGMSIFEAQYTLDCNDIPYWIILEKYYRDQHWDCDYTEITHWMYNKDFIFPPEEEQKK